MQESINKARDHYVVTRRFYASIRGSLAQFGSSGQDAASWTPVNGKVADVFGIGEIMEQNCADPNTGSAMLQNAILHRISILESKNDFPLALGVSISCIPSDESTRTGHKYAMTALASSHNANPLVLFEAEPSTNEGMQFRQEFPQYNSSNLETHGVLNVQGEPYVFVSKSHPVINLLKKNAATIKSDITQTTLIDGEWYKVGRQVMSFCCQELRKKVLSRVNTRDLNNFTMQLHRIGNRDWNQLSANDEIMSAVPPHVAFSDNPTDLTKHVENIMKTPYSYSARIELTYEVVA